MNSIPDVQVRCNLKRSRGQVLHPGRARPGHEGEAEPEANGGHVLRFGKFYDFANLADLLKQL